MATEKQIAANRRNSKQSTGPKTKGGQARSSRNSLRYGLSAKQMLVGTEKPQDFVRFYRELYADLKPVGAAEKGVADYVILCQWRLRRIPRAEASFFSDVCDGDNLGNAYQAAPQSVAAITRHETTLNRSLQRGYHQLERLQARRKGEPVLAPIAVDVAVSNDADEGVSSVPPQTVVGVAPGVRKARKAPDVAREARDEHAKARQLTLGYPAADVGAVSPSTNQTPPS